MLKEIVDADTQLIWRLLDENGVLSIDQLIHMTGYWGMYIHLALGWLLHENKIAFIEVDNILCVELMRKLK